MSNKHIDRIFKRSKAKLIALPIVAVILIGILIAANVVLNMFAPILHRVFAGDSADIPKEVREEADAVVRKTAEESMVLLYNEETAPGKNFLPLTELSKVNLFGWGSTDGGFLLTGGGSGGATVLDKDRKGRDRIKVDLTDAFYEAGIEYNTKLTKAYTDFSSFDADYRKGGTTGADVTESLKNPGASFYTTDRMNQAKTYSQTAVAVISRWGAENASGQELKSVGSYSNGSFLKLTSAERAMFEKLNEYRFDVIVVLNVCNNIELGFLEEYDCIKACIFAGIPGQSGAIAIPEIIKGTVNPSGRISDTLPYDNQKLNPTYANAVKTGTNIVYQEGIYFGYKWYETADADGFFEAHGTSYDEVVQFPFGHGLSYTSFDWTADFTNVTALEEEGKYSVTVTVTNTGTVAGKDVVQLYGHAPYDPKNGIEKAERVLLDFAKTPLLYPANEANGTDKPNSCTVELTFTAYDLASYDVSGKGGYKLDVGDYKISVMNDAHNYKNATGEGYYTEVKLNKAITYTEDPVTHKAVGNLFTGSDAYAGYPIDGSRGTKPVTYLSRAKGAAVIDGKEVQNVAFANYTEERANCNSGKPSIGEIERANKKLYEGKLKDVQYGKVSEGMFLVGSQKEDGSLERVSLDVLSGETESPTPLYFNTPIIKILVQNPDGIYWDILLNQVSEKETQELIGAGGFQTMALYSAGKSFCKDKDGPAGFNNSVDDALEAKSDQYTLFCSESLTGCSFSKEIAYSIGEAQAKIADAAVFQGWYGPGVNLHRNVYNSRNYEYYSEDAVLSGKLAASTVTAAYDNNMYCYIKHFAVSEAGSNPKNLNTWLTEQTLRESYLRPFEIAVKYGHANGMMSAFNNVGGVCAGYNGALLTGVLRNEWGFKGSVITDWFMKDGYMNDYNVGVLAGNNLWLNGTFNDPATLNLSDPYVAYAARQSVKSIIYTYIDTNQTATEVKISPAPHSTLLDALWAVADVILSLGIIACVVFTVLPYTRKKQAAPAPEGNEGGEGDGGEAVPEEPDLNEQANIKEQNDDEKIDNQ